MSSFARVLLIVANAGSGKTHRLVTRCLELMARGEPPDKILALTFTRKAAAEFLQKLFARLAGAATDAASLAQLRRDLGLPDLTADECLRWLRQLSACLPRLSMGTMDQFFGRILRSFPFELGLGRDVQVMDEAAQEETRRRALEAMFAMAAGEDLDQFVDLLRQESRNRASQSALRAITAAAEGLQQSFLETPRDVVWGDPGTIWPAGSDLLSAPPVADAARDFWDEVEKTQGGLGATARAAWKKWLDLACAHRPPRRMDAELDKFLSEKLGKCSTDKKTGEDYVPVGGRGEDRLFLRGRIPQLREDLRRALLRPELEAKLQSARALHALLARYEAVYDSAVREGGALTYSDIATILAAQSGSPWRQDLDYRLDGRHDHWLLDEFQDTSRLQWEILEPLADEIIQDTSGRRTFFYVGDTKQAIYGWRGGDARLFWDIRDHYNHGDSPVVMQEELEISRRSSKAIVRAVEAVLTPAELRAGAEEFRFPASTVEEWTRAWVPHQPAPRAPEGYARFEVVPATDEDGSSEDRLERAVVDIIREADPIGRGLECAILVRTRDALARYVDLLKREGIPVAGEGKTNPCVATASGRALLALCRFVATPADTLSLGFVQASPLRFLLDGDPDAFRLSALCHVAAHGFAATVRVWTGRAVSAGILAPGEMEAFISAAADFDAARTSAADWGAFIRQIELASREQGETPGAVRVLTIHTAKGLGMDMVILPELGGKALSEFREDAGITLHRDARGRVLWGMALPRKDFCDADPVLGAAREEIRARQSYEALCVLYVAMTRAKKALYCLAAGGRNAKNAGNWLERTFPSGAGARRESGHERWFEAHPVGAAGGDAEPPAPKPLPRPGSAAVHQPSAQKAWPAANVLRGGAVRRLGSEMHRLLAQVEWLDPDPPRFEGAPGPVRAVTQFLSGDEGREIFSRPAWDCLLWRERAFDVELEGRMVSGVFDRVQIRLGPGGQPASAEVLDFKTGPDRGQYQRQMADYRAAAAALLGLPPERVSTRIVVVAPA